MSAGIEIDGETGLPQQWYYCLEHHRVERGRHCPARERLGPFDSPEQASRALETAQRNNEQWDAEEPEED
ncbi:hypothetical protein ACFYNO_18000 [Kitasatospora sp. NPDC006697]|uniref:hypothetical protein n=1 Tax=Kitasatospora sp. NPDC006697 TaxID=3364020 RepID=UPI00367CAA2A